MNNTLATTNNSGAITKYYKPSELIGIFNNMLSRQNENAQVVFLRGVYLMNPKQGNWAYCYDTLRDEDSQEELTIVLTHQQRADLKNGNLVMVGGVIGRNVSNKGYIQLTLKVSRIEVVQEQAVDEAEIKRMELRQKKASVGFKNVDSILEQKLYTDQRPRVALIFAETSITDSDFNAGINAAKSAIDFDEYRVNFSNSTQFIERLQNVDENWYDVIAVVRGGGSGIEKLDDLSVLEAIVGLKTPIIAAIGHVEEKLFIKQLVDKAAPTPNGLGQYFSEMVETVSEKKSKSRAVLTEQIKKQFKEQLEAGQKQNKALQEKLQALTKSQDEATKKHNEQLKTEQKQNKELQEKLKVLTENHAKATKTQEEANKKHQEQVEAANKQNKQLQEQMAKLTETQNQQLAQQKKQQEELNKNLTQMQTSNAQLQKSLTEMTTQNATTAQKLTEAQSRAKDLEQQLAQANGGNIWKYVAIAAIIVALIALFIR